MVSCLYCAAHTIHGLATPGAAGTMANYVALKSLLYLTPRPSFRVVVQQKLPTDHISTSKHNPISVHVPVTVSIPHGSPSEPIVCACENLVKWSGPAGG